MTAIDPSLDLQAAACAVDRSCAASGCGCATTAGTDQQPAPSRRGLKAGLLAVACSVGCLAVPFAIGAAAAASGAVAGELRLLAALAVAAIVGGVAVASRRRTGKLC